MIINSYKILFLYPKNVAKTFTTSKDTQIQNKSDNLINANDPPIKARKIPIYQPIDSTKEQGSKTTDVKVEEGRARVRPSPT